MKRTLSVNPETGLRETFVGHDNGFSVVTEQDCAGVLQSARAARDAQGSTRGHDFRFVGTIPLVLAQQWATESGTTIFSPEYNEYVRRKLNSNEFRDLRVWEGRV
jgi:hypothetical protein